MHFKMPLLIATSIPKVLFPVPVQPEIKMSCCWALGAEGGCVEKKGSEAIGTVSSNMAPSVAYSMPKMTCYYF